MAALPRTFLTAQWRYLAMLNYEVDRRILEPLLPAYTELDAWHGRTYVSLVGFLFQGARVLGMPVPMCRNFEEVNLRFYVRRKVDSAWRRGVVFVKELVPRAAIAWVARAFYNENYVAVPMGHCIDRSQPADQPSRVTYSWRFARCDHRIELFVAGSDRPVALESEEEFITEHYWGYCRQRDGGTVEYEVEHPRWRVWSAREVRYQGDAAALYGPEFAERLAAPPRSAFLARGSRVAVHRGVRLKDF
jgi:uncharacterized protein